MVPADNKIIVFSFDPITDTKVRLSLDCNHHQPSIGIWHVSSRLTFPRFILSAFDPDKHKINMENNVSRAGELLAMTRSSVLRTPLATFNKVPADWVTTYFNAFWDGCVNCASPRPFFFAWEPGNHPLEVYYVWIDAPEYDCPYNDITRAINLQMTGLYELP
jgi:hypothetical protein